MFRTLRHNSHKYASLKLSCKVSLKCTECNPFGESFWTVNNRRYEGCYQCADFLIYNGNRTEWSPILSVIIQVIITKSDDREAGVRFVNHEYDNRLNWTTR